MTENRRTSTEEMRRIAWDHEFDLLDGRGRSRMFVRTRARAAAANRCGSHPTQTSGSGASRHVEQLVGRHDGMMPVLAGGDVPLTRHAQHRLKNRGITIAQVLAVSLFGKEKRSHGASRHYLDKNARELMNDALPHDTVRSLGRLDIVAVFDDSGALVTAAHRTRRLRND